MRQTHLWHSQRHNDIAERKVEVEIFQAQKRARLEVPQQHQASFHFFLFLNSPSTTYFRFASIHLGSSPAAGDSNSVNSVRSIAQAAGLTGRPFGRASIYGPRVKTYSDGQKYCPVWRGWASEIYVTSRRHWRVSAHFAIYLCHYKARLVLLLVEI